MENKYYTPELSEFHIGFEFEFSGLDKDWNDCPFEIFKIITKKEAEKSIYKHTMDWVEKIYHDEVGVKHEHRIRVKYLDKDDIESFGFKKDGDYGNYSLFYYGIWTLEYGIWTLEHHPKKNIVDIWNDMGNSENSFRGVIKNKSELEKILKQIGVL